MEGSNYDCAVVMIQISFFFLRITDHEITRIVYLACSAVHSWRHEVWSEDKV